VKFKIIGIGETLWDLLPTGKQLGGAPANFAYHARTLGADARVISRIGQDNPGREILDRLQKLGLPTDTIQIDRSAPTGAVSVTLDPAGQPQYTIHENVAWDNLALEPIAQTAAAEADAICFGTLAQRHEPSRSTILSLVQATPAKGLRIFDINLRQQYYSRALAKQSLGLANVLKVNDSELPELAKMFALSGDERAQIAQLTERYELRAVAFTRGDRGSLLYSANRWSDHPGISTKVVDTIGAGDSFTAAMTLGLLARWELDKINRHANEIAAYVASCAGATPALPPQLRAPFGELVKQGKTTRD